MTHDIFLRKEVFKDEPWYNEFLNFCNIGVCQPENEEHIEPLQKALHEYGYETRTSVNKGKTYIIGKGARE